MADRMALYRPRKPTQNAFIESFYDKLRDECLNETLSPSLTHARRGSTGRTTAKIAAQALTGNAERYTCNFLNPIS